MRETGLVLDNALPGDEFPLPSLTLLIGQPGCGKSQLVVQWATSWAQQGHPVLWLAGDDGAARQAQLANQALITCWDQQDLPMMTAKALCQRLKRMLYEVIVIDDSRSLQPNSDSPAGAFAPGTARNQAISQQLRQLADREQCCIIVIGSASRQHLLTSAQLTGATAHYGVYDYILTLVDRQPVELALVKNRHGPASSVELSFRPDGRWLPIFDDR